MAYTDRLVVALIIGLCVTEISCIADKLYVYTPLEEPLVMLKKSEDMRHDQDKYEGFFVDLWTKIANEIDRDWQIKLSSEMGSRQADGTFSGAVGEVFRRRGHVAGPVLISSEYNNLQLSLTTPFLNTGISGVRKRPRPEWHASYASNLCLVLKPFTWKVWVALVVCFFLTGLLMYSLRHFTKTEAPRSQCADAFWWTFRVVSTEGNNSQSTPISMRIASVTWFCFTLVLGIIYVSIMVHQIPSSVRGDNLNGIVPVKHIKDLAGQDKVKFGVVKGSRAMAFLSRSHVPAYQKMYAQTVKAPGEFDVNTTEGGFQKVHESDGNYVFIDDTHLRIDNEIGKKPCELERVGEFVTSDGLGLVVPADLRKPINSAILRFKDLGELDELYKKWFVERSKCHRFDKNGDDDDDDYDLLNDDDDETPPKADLDAMISPLIILVAGYLISIIACIITHIGRCHSKREKDINDCQMNEQ